MPVDHSDQIRIALRGITVKEAAKHLRTTFQSAYDDLKYHGVNTELSEVLFYRPELSCKLASSVQVRFFGGPPGRKGWFDGTVYTYLCDKIMDCVAHKDTARLARFLKAATR